MARGGDARGPYWTAARLWLWVCRYVQWVAGRYRLAGGDPDVLGVRELIEVAYPLYVEWASDPALRARIDKADELLAKPLWPERDDWGMDAAALDGASAMIEAMRARGPGQ